MRVDLHLAALNEHNSTEHYGAMLIYNSEYLAWPKRLRIKEEASGSDNEVGTVKVWVIWKQQKGVEKKNTLSWLTKL